MYLLTLRRNQTYLEQIYIRHWELRELGMIYRCDVAVYRSTDKRHQYISLIKTRLEEN